MEAEDLRNRFEQDTGKTPYLKSTSEGFHVARREYANWLESKLQALKEKVEELGALDIKVKIENKEGERIEERPFIEKKEVLNLITNLEDKQT